jgi:indolepyruvate ferredoxin oxidoreductase beta subunit
VWNTLKNRKNTIILDADSIAKELKSPRSSNIVILGAASPFIDLPYSSLEDAIKEIFLRKGDKIIEANLKALKAGRDCAQNR